MIRSAAVVPCPPLLVAHLAGAGSDASTDALRAACRAAAAALPRDRWHVVGVDAGGPAAWASGVTGDFRGYGLAVDVALGGPGPVTAAPASEPDPGPAATRTPGLTGGLPLALLVAGWLAGEAGARVVTSEVLAPDTPAARCLARGRELAVEFRDDDVGLLVVGDGSRLHDVPGAGRVDERAAEFDAAVAAALAGGDAAALAGVDADVAASLGAEGRAAWHVLAGVAGAPIPAAGGASTSTGVSIPAARGASTSTGASARATGGVSASDGGGVRWRGELVWTGAPHGVGYHVAVWRR